jgi:hypothetical protein
VSAKTNFNIEDLFNKVIDDLQTTHSAKKKEVAPTNATQAETSSNASKVEK